MSGLRLPRLRDFELEFEKLNGLRLNGDVSFTEFTRRASCLINEFKPRNVKRNIRTKHKTTTKKGKNEYMRLYMQLRRKEKKTKGLMDL